ncbi:MULTISPECIES: KEOPS complex subunit Cgi121 [Ferroplasma]|jgi:hypothetical protein|uniref:Uncharacterized protein n=2 Tax=Ferroplasma TaxID=74968 RepID=S0ATE6_FERAC|nr:MULTISPECIES: KEOPS complex subunit Cgi121 [Ferroplasma]MCL4348601.1 EKC/KEOPS complex subunit CGI121/TPRKB [Candidatus Thermoplasmatota archaeon]AGO61319.1 hypothetical protein FACI_IFERC00001G1339 [Ferroplasma acidarmanus Fer1]ARD84273.1 hypothetical protein FAD_0352 [Ferroplasma acidiphilum]NOL59510.1 hypothetical protein [Ferroplasma acidiphilum]WMT53178.1 MAG: KEOPS complex subunit Cgi121 [Ferroplasma acidiphilum]
MLHDLQYFILKYYNNKIFDYLKTRTSLIQLIDGNSISSELELSEAIRKTDRYLEHNGKIHFPGTVLLMYLAHTNQINVAINRCGINPDTQSGVVVYSNREDLDFLIEGGYIKLTERFIPYDLPRKDFEVFSSMARLETMI